MAFARLIITTMKKSDASEPRRIDFERFAKEIIADLDAVSAKIETLERWEFESEDAMRAYVNVPETFLHSTVALVQDTPTLRELNRLDVADGRETLEYLAAFASVYNRTDALRTRVKLNMKSRKTRLAAQAMQIYALAKTLARDGKNPGLAAHLEVLAHDLGPRGRPRKKRNE